MVPGEGLLLFGNEIQHKSTPHGPQNLMVIPPGVGGISNKKLVLQTYHVPIKRSDENAVRSILSVIPAQLTSFKAHTTSAHLASLQAGPSDLGTSLCEDCLPHSTTTYKSTFFLRELTKMPPLHIVDSKSGLSVARVVTSRELDEAVRVVETEWYSICGPPLTASTDPEFAKDPFLPFLKDYEVKFEARAAQRRNKIGIVESKNNTLRTLTRRLVKDAGYFKTTRGYVTTTREILSRKVFLANIFYGDKRLSSLEMVRGYTPSLVGLQKTQVHSSKLTHRHAKIPLLFRCKPISNSYGHTGYLSGMHLSEGGEHIYHLVDWHSAKQSRVSFSSIGAEVLAAAYSADRGFLMSDCIAKLKGLQVASDNGQVERFFPSW